jgi:hypothetical protein
MKINNRNMNWRREFMKRVNSRNKKYIPTRTK